MLRAKSCAPLPTSAGPQAAYLLIEALAAAAAETVPLNFCLVLDRSGSMQGAKLAAMKDATKRVIDTLTPRDVVAIVLFDDTVQVLAPALGEQVMFRVAAPEERWEELNRELRAFWQATS